MEVDEGDTSVTVDDKYDTEDAVTKIQDELVRLGNIFALTLEEIQQRHAPEAAPAPPIGMDPAVHYAQFWAQRHAERPFATRGFEWHEQSAKQDVDVLKLKAKEMLDVVQLVDKLMSDAGIDRPEQEQMEELAQLEKENQAAGEELDQAVGKANEFLEKVAKLQRKVAASALGV